MAEAAVAAIGAEIGGTFGASLIMYAGEIAFAIQLTASIATLYNSTEGQRRRAEKAARDAHNSSLRDRYLMVRSATEPRKVVLGRQRVSGPLAYIGSYGAQREKLIFAVILAAHEIDGIEAIYFDDELVTLDGPGGTSGNVQAINRREFFTLTGASDTFTLTTEPKAGTVVATAAYGTTIVTLGTSVSGSAVTVTGGTVGQTGTVTISYQPAQSLFTWTDTASKTATVTLDGSGNGSVVLPETPDAGTVQVIHADGGVGIDQNLTNLGSFTSVSGATVTVTGAPVTGNATVNYSVTTSGSKARVRHYLGAAGQAADAGMVSALPGIWTSAHTMTGLAYLVVELDYSPDAFPSGMPNVSARVRGAKVYDPRTGLTVWSENPALLMRHVATSPLLGRLPTSAVNDTTIAAAATACDQVVNYVVDGRTYARPLYTAGLVCSSANRAEDYLNDLAEAMAGQWVIVDGQIRVKAGVYTAPLITLDDSWVVTAAPVRYQARPARDDLFNVVTGTFSDEQRDYQVLPFPRVESASYVTEDGQALERDMTLNAVTFSGQAQQVVATRMRELRFGERLVVACNHRAYPVEPFDTLTVNLTRWGMSGEVFEVVDVGWSVDGGIILTMRKTAPSVYALGVSFAAPPLPPNSLRVSPLAVPAVAGLAVASGTNYLLKQGDGTIVSRMRVSFTAPTNPFVLNGGGTEVRYGLATTPEAQWQSVEAMGGQNEVFITDARDGWIYLVKARHFNDLVRGPWTPPVLHAMVGKTQAPGNVAGITATQVPGGVLVKWTPNAEADYMDTEIRSGANWAAGTLVWRGTADRYLLPWPAAGSLTLWLAHRDTSRNYSSTPQSVALTVDGTILIGTPQIKSESATKIVADSSSTLSYSFVSNVAGFEYRVQRLLPISWTNDTGATVTVELSAEIGGTKSAGPGSVWLDAGSQADSALTSGNFSSLGPGFDHTNVTAAHGRYTHSNSLQISPGATIHFALTVYIFSADGTTTSFSGFGRLRIVAIKR